MNECSFCKKDVLSYLKYNGNNHKQYCSLKCMENEKTLFKINNNKKNLDVPLIITKRKCKNKTKFQNKMRKLWSDHVFWTRLFIKSASFDSPDLSLTENRLLRNQEDIGKLFGKYYGEKIEVKLTNLLKEHIIGAGKIVIAVKNKTSEEDTKLLIKEWYDNAEHISKFLFNLNKENWTLKILNDAMKKHLDDTLSEAGHALNNEFDKDIEDFDNIYNHILNLSDVLSLGIIKQFERKFQ